MHYAFVGYDRPNGLARRMAARPEHLQHLESLGERLILAGPFLDDKGDMVGSIMVIEADSQEDAEATFGRDPFVVGNGLALPLSASVGVALTSDPSARPADLLRDADTAMYRVKQQGRNGFHVFDASADRESEEQLLLAAELQHAVERGQFVLAYQPLLSLTDQRLLGFEALLRWQHPVRGTLLPGAFLPVAERMGLMGQIGAWVLDAACARLAAWSADSPAMAGSGALSMAVNVSGSQLRAGGFIDQVRTALHAHGLAPGSLRLEISERDLIHDDPRVEATLAALGAMGVQLAVDDFGASVTSLARLPRIPVSVVKLARFADLGQREVVAAVIATAHGLGMSVVGGGIEDAEQLAQLSALACDDGQGFLLGPPLEESDAGQLLRDGPSVAPVR